VLECDEEELIVVWTRESSTDRVLVGRARGGVVVVLRGFLQTSKVCQTSSSSLPLHGRCLWKSTVGLSARRK